MKKTILLLILFVSKISFANPRLEQYRQLLQSRNVVTLEEAVALLPATDRKNFTLMKASIGLQQASLEAPRALVFGESADIIFTFNSHAEQGGGSDLEIMSFNPATKVYDFEVITFKDGQRTFSEKNPQMCLACHSSFGKPLWGAQGEYPRAFGSDRDVVTAEEIEALGWLRNNPRMRYLLRDEAVPQSPYRLSVDESSLEAQPNQRFASLIEAKYVQTLKAKMNPAFFNEQKYWVKLFLEEAWHEQARNYAPQVEKLLSTYLAPEELQDIERILRRLGKTDVARFHYIMTALMFGTETDPWVLDRVNAYSLSGTRLTEKSLQARLYAELF